MPTLSSLTQTSYLIMMHPPIVLQDIIETIADYAPEAAIIQVQTPQEAAEALSSVTTIMAAILRMPPTSAAALGLAKTVRDLGGQVVFFGDEAEEIGPGPSWTILKSPFTTNSLMSILRNRRKAGLPVDGALTASGALTKLACCS